MGGGAAAGAALPGQQAGRALLLGVARAIAGIPVVDWPARLAAEAARCGQGLQWRGELHDEPVAAGVRVAHHLKMGQPGLQCWSARWEGEAAGAPLRLATRVASLLAGMDYLLLLAADASGGGEPAGAVVDGESCARMAVAGYDPEIEAELGNHAELLHSAGDLVSLVPGAATHQAVHIVLGLRLHAAARD